MDSHERVVRAIERTGPDRPPITHATLPGAAKRHGEALSALHRRYPSDVISVGGATTGEYGPQIGVISRDTWGSGWLRHTDEHKGQPVDWPLADLEQLDTFEPPDTSSDEILTAIEGRLAENAGRCYTIADGDIIWQRMIYLHGFEATLGDLVVDSDGMASLRDMIVSVMMARVERLCQLPGLDGIHFRDDWGTQKALMIRPALWRSFFGPSYAVLFRRTREAGKHVWFHSDGVIEEIVPDLIAMGANVLNPQTDVMGRERLAAMSAGKLCFQADIDRQWALPFGTPGDCRRAVRADLAAFASPSGGYIGRAESAGDVPLENLEAVYDEVVSFRFTQ